MGSNCWGVGAGKGFDSLDNYLALETRTEKIQFVQLSNMFVFLLCK